MNKMQIATRVLVFLLLVLPLVGCSTPTVVVPPTQDIPAVRTEAAQTVVAKITIEAALNPTATTAPTQAAPEPIVITATEAPKSAESTPTATSVAAQATATLVPIATATRQVGGGIPAPTRTTRPGPDLAQLVSQEPQDGIKVKAGTEFDAHWTFKNIGTSTWNTGYDYRAVGSTKISKKSLYTLSKSVKPGESVTLIADMVAPSSAGRYTSHWELVNQNGDIFYEFFLVVIVE